MSPSRRPSAAGVVAGAIMTVTACECRYAVDGEPEPDAGDATPEVVVIAGNPAPDATFSHLVPSDAGSVAEELDGGASVASLPGSVAGANDAGVEGASSPPGPGADASDAGVAGAPPQGGGGGGAGDQGDGNDQDCHHGHGHGHGHGDDEGCGGGHGHGHDLRGAETPDAGDEIGSLRASSPTRPPGDRA